ncbi:D-alanyl-D-alanine carboxypeptidase family protein [Bacillus niameyensis]|uniref:D-alanyl-D-alanine carboxypeptidase family protein n=1 Tax=Bacillus niameyensis TaxID=1522308 RepID=UPI00078512CA|nr:D-alanyl-D-alanine carboxypeptidase family protein [Bacillus niameyensis]
MRVEKIIAIIILTVISIQMLPNRTQAMSVSASGAILMEQNSGRVLYEQNAHEVHRIASITKVMTAIVAIESGKLDEKVTISKRAVYTEGSSIYLEIGEEMKLEDLVYGLMLRSGNDAATAIAEHVGGSVEGFVFLMNRKAEEIGMKDTVFSNPHGLDDHEEHYSTAYDMALMTRYAMMNEKFREISGTKLYKFERGSGPQGWKNKNRLLTEKYKYTTGGKTGFTKRAGRTLITTATKKNEDLIAVTLNAPDDWNDHISMYEYGFKTYSDQSIINKGRLEIDAEGLEKKELFIQNPIIYPLAEDESEEIRMEYKLLQPEKLKKLDEGKAGIAILYFQGEPVKQEYIYIREVEEQKDSDWWQYIKNLLFNRDDAA